MRKLLHAFLKWFPAAVTGGVVAVAGVWESARDWIGQQLAWAWEKTESPWIIFFVIAVVSAYILAIFITGREKGPHQNALTGKNPPEEFKCTSPLPVYLSTTPPVFGKQKMILCVWDPEACILEFRGDGPFVDWPPKKTAEPDLTLNLFNSGPEDIRHVQVDWILSNRDLPALIEESNLFGDRLVSVNESRLRIGHEKRGSSMPLFSSVESFPTIPVVKSGETIPIEAPVGMTMAWTVSTLIFLKMKRSPDAAALLAKGVMEILDNQERVPDLKIIINYYVEAGKQQQVFYLIGWGRSAGTGSCMSRTPKEDGSFYHVADGETALIEGVQVFRED